mmetsp:Transcript_62396/g.76417  ORF Transcript_62396/g.76417 Transcript_62396/m.76417 type:complete len:105 (+) Transcript_62396:119-433(+)
MGNGSSSDDDSGYSLYCEGCGHNYFTVGSKTWYTRGDVSRYPGYCGCCVGKSRSGWTWKGYVVKLKCFACTNIYNIITWDDWTGSSGETTGYCRGCYERYKLKK